MKISPFAQVIPFPSPTLRSQRSDGEGGSGRQQYDPNQTSKDGGEQEGKREPAQPDPQLIDQAVSSFQSDEATQAHGLSATVEGTGPGLRIHVKDCNGTTLRRFSGEEFLKIREGTTLNPGKRGKILDQKL